MYFWTLAVTLVILASETLSQLKIPKWADVFIRNDQGFSNLEYKLGFLMDNYDVISLEKCLTDGHDGGHNTEVNGWKNDFCHWELPQLL